MLTLTLNLDWEELRTQKMAVITCLPTYPELEGLLNLIDYIQEEGEKQGERVLWIAEDDEDDTNG